VVGKDVVDFIDVPGEKRLLLIKDDVARPVGHDRLEAREGIGLGVVGFDTFGLSGAQVETGAREQTHTDQFV
jgi:hypothetical protein